MIYSQLISITFCQVHASEQKKQQKFHHQGKVLGYWATTTHTTLCGQNKSQHLVVEPEPLSSLQLARLTTLAGSIPCPESVGCKGGNRAPSPQTILSSQFASSEPSNSFGYDCQFPYRTLPNNRAHAVWVLVKVIFSHIYAVLNSHGESGIPELLYPHTEFPGEYCTPVHGSLVNPVRGYNFAQWIKYPTTYPQRIQYPSIVLRKMR